MPSPKGAPDKVEAVKLVEHGDAVDVGTRRVVDLGGRVAYFLGGYEGESYYAVAWTEDGFPRFVDGGGGVLLKNAIGMEALIFVLDDAVFEKGRVWRSRCSVERGRVYPP